MRSHSSVSSPQQALEQHYQKLLACRRCPGMASAPVSGKPVLSQVMLIGQAPGDKEPKLGRPFAWTAGKTMFRWFEENCGLNEERFRNSIYMAAVCRCFPGKRTTGGDRVPVPDEIINCSDWMDAEISLLQPKLVIPVGKLAMGQFGFEGKLDELIGQKFRRERAGASFDVIPLPHPSGASPWHRMEPGKALVKQALALIAKHPAWGRIGMMPDA
jgi:uracil-DNA glycosylase